MMKRIIRRLQKVLFVAGVSLPFIVSAQQQKQLTIGDCYDLAKKNYPLIQQSELIEKTKDYTIDNLSKGNLPQVVVNGQATYQSDVTKYPIVIANMKVPALAKDQYRIYGEMNQPLTDVFSINLQKGLTDASSKSQQQQLEVELYKLKDRINQLYFGALLADEQIVQNELLKKDIKTGIDKINAAITNGTAFKSNAQMLEAELLKADQHTIELAASRKSFRDMLGFMTGVKIDDNTQLKTPEPVITASNINRPELKMYELQKEQFSVQQKLVDNRKIPKVGVFLQGGYGRPALDFLSNEFKAYYITGLRLNWNLASLYTIKKEKDILNISRKNIEVQKETFLFNTNVNLSQQTNDIEKYRQLVNTDNSIITLREKVKFAATAQLENGVITANDFITYVNAEDQARQAKALHNTQLLLAQYNYQNTTGN